MPQSDVWATSHKGLIVYHSNLSSSWIQIITRKYSAYDNKLVTPFTWITFNRVYHSRLYVYTPETVTGVDTEIWHWDWHWHWDDVQVLDRGHGYSNDFDSAEFVLFNHSQQISVVTRTSSVYGVLEETHLTSTHPFHISLPGITLGDVQEKP